MHTRLKTLEDAQQVLQERLGRLDPRQHPKLQAVYRWLITDAASGDRSLLIAVGPAPAESSQYDIGLQISWADFVAMFTGKQDPLTLFTTNRLRLHDRDGAAVPFERVQKLLLLALAGWHVTPQAVAMLESCHPLATEMDRIERVHAPDRAHFLQVYALQGRPVIISGAMNDWAICALSLPDLRDLIGDHIVAVFARAASAQPSADDTNSGAISTSGRIFSKMSLSKYIDDVLIRPRYVCDLAKPVPYVTANSIPDNLLERIQYPEFFERSVFLRPKMWLGPGGTLQPVHRDLIDNFLAQVWGFKHIRLLAPEQAPHLYPQRVDQNPYYEPCEVDVDAPDFENHPELAKARYIDCVLGPGEMLYIPAGWWHRVRSLEPSLSLNFFAIHQMPRAIMNHAENASTNR